MQHRQSFSTFCLGHPEVGDDHDGGTDKAAGSVRTTRDPSLSALAPCSGGTPRVVPTVRPYNSSARWLIMNHSGRSQYSVFDLSGRDIQGCLDIISRAILLSAWLAATARKHLSRFREFIIWLRFGNRLLGVSQMAC